MFKTVAPNVWFVDAEWVPDPPTGRRVYGIDASVSDEAVVEQMWKAGGATEEEPRPYLKTVLCRVVSVAAFVRRRLPDGSVAFDLRSFPDVAAGAMMEADLLTGFFEEIGGVRPQIVGFNFADADIPILLQRAAVSSVSAPEFCRRPDKPWEGIDYFVRGGEGLVDLRQVYGGWGRSTPSLHELATSLRIPGKIETSGDMVIDLWRAGDVRGIVEYNRFDVLTTYLVWLRTAHLGGHIDTPTYRAEEKQCETFLRGRIVAGERYLERYIDAWHRLRDAG